MEREYSVIAAAHTETGQHTMQIFISYAHVDEYRVEELVDILRASDHDPWFDHRLKVGRSWEEQLLEAIQECDRFLYALTPESVASAWCQWEFAQAVHADKPVIPVLVQAGTAIDGALGGVQWADFSKGPTPISAVKLITGVQEASVIDPARVPLLDPPHAAPERPMEQVAVSSAMLEDQWFDEASAAFRAREYDAARDLLCDCLDLDADHANAQKLLALVERRIAEQVRKQVAEMTQITRRVLPQPFEWVAIPAGAVVLEDASEYEGTTGGRYDVPAFEMAKYPITNAQFQVFVDAADGYRDAQWWGYSDHAQRWRAGYGTRKNTTFYGDDLPRTDVCWYEALAFCRWLSSRTGQTITLPTEQQWQRAAQGDDGRMYPWGNDFDAEKCNTRENGISQTSSVTRYPDGASPYGVLDMAGNVWEWCLTAWGTDSTDVQVAAWRVTRGGAFINNQDRTRCAFRGTDECGPGGRDEFIGFRVVCGVPHR